MMLSVNDMQAHSEHARSTGLECASFYINFDTNKPYDCSCGFEKKTEAPTGLRSDGWYQTSPYPPELGR